MSQNKTVVPGMEGTSSSVNQVSDNFYSRGYGNQQAVGGTVVPGMQQMPIAESGPRNTVGQPAAINEKPIVGFLYSISRQGSGEYWPLHIGQNTIGSSPQCDICLREGTVSSEHAVLVVRLMKKPEKTIASISDSRSTNGTLINGSSLGFNAQECVNTDIITIGENYELLLLLIDAANMGLRVSEGFVSMPQTTTPTNQRGANGSNKLYNIPTEGDPDIPFAPYQPNYPEQSGYSADGTVGMDNNDSPTVSGGTRTL